MSTRHLEKLFKPNSLAVFGASDQPGRVGQAVFANLLAGGFKGAIYPVNPKRKEVAGHRAWPSAKSLPETPDLAIICTPPPTVPGIVDELGRRGTRAAVVITAGFESVVDKHGEKLSGRLLKGAGRHGLRLLGPNCVGLIVPGLGLNASFAPAMAQPGSLAFVSQSGGLATTVLDWAAEREIGFSSFVSMGNCLDVDIADVVDYLGVDARTRAILLYIESVNTGRKFMSAARAAARNKPMIVVKSGRAPEGARAAQSHTGALAGSDEVFDAAISRAGALRVDGIEALFSAAELLGRPHRVRGPRLAILTNGGGPGVLATDKLILSGGELATLSETTMATLDECLPANWSRANPVDIIGDAGPERHVQALKVLLADEGVDAVLLIHAPTALTDAAAIASALVEPAARARQIVLGCFLGGASARQASRIFADAGLASFSTPEEAVKAFLRILEYRSNQEALMQIPDPPPGRHDPDHEAVGRVIEQVRTEQRVWLNEVESKQVLAACGIPVVETRTAVDEEAAVREAERIGFPVALKILSPDITHKSDVGGVVLDLGHAEAVREAARSMRQRVTEQRAGRLSGFSVQAMARRPGALELILGMSTDSVFGPVLLFGHGGTAVEVVRDHALALPPLNMNLARRQIMKTRVSRLMAGYRGFPPVAGDRVAEALIQLGNLVLEQPLIESLEINPLLADADGIIALDARVQLREQGAPPRPKSAIAPYPAELEEHLDFNGQRIVVRAIRPEDEPAHRDFFDSLGEEDVRFRFFGVLRRPEHGQLARYTQIDYDREIALIAAEVNPPGRTLGVVRVALDSAYRCSEFAIVVRTALKGQGLGRLLLTRLIDYCRSRGVSELSGQVMENNHRMLALARELGFVIEPAVEGVHSVVLKLDQTP